jgi:hypothetical protein
MKTRILILSVFVLMFIAGIQAASPVPDPRTALEAPGGSDLIADWITAHIKTIRASKVITHHQRQMAYTGIAMNESIVAGDKNYKSLAGQLNDYQPPPSLPVAADICWQASANSAISKMLSFFYRQDFPFL